MVSDAARLAEYHKNLMVEMDLAPVNLCVAMSTDSQGAEALVANPVQRQRTKYIALPPKTTLRVYSPRVQGDSFTTLRVPRWDSPGMTALLL